MPKISGEGDFLNALRAQKTGNMPGNMHMTTPPEGRGLSLQEMVAAEQEKSAGEPVATSEVPQAVKDGNIREISVEKVVDSPYQIKVISDDDLDAMIESSRETKGFTSYIVVRPVGDKFELVVGHRRFKSAVRDGKKTITAIVRDLSDFDAARALAADNFVKHPLSDFESYLQIRVFEEKGFASTTTGFARLLGRSRQDILRYQAFGGLPESALKFLNCPENRDLIGGTAAKQLSAFVVDYPESAEKAIDECLKRLAGGEFKTQDAMVSAVESLLTNNGSAAKKEKPSQFLVVDDQNNQLAKVVMSKSGIKISGKGLDMERIGEMLRRELPNCKSSD